MDQKPEQAVLTRADIGKILQKSNTGVRRLEEVEQVRRKLAGEPPIEEEAAEPSPEDGETASAVFGDLNAGKTPVEIVIARKLRPVVVEQLHAIWVRAHPRNQAQGDRLTKATV